MGSIRTWSLAAVAGIFVVVVAHQRSNAEAESANAPPAAVAVPAGRVIGLPDFSGLVAEYGAAVVNISVVEKPQKFGGADQDSDDDPLSQFFHRYQLPGQPPDHTPPSHGIGSGFIITPDGY